MQFSDFIRKNMEAILEEWEAFARSLPPGRDMDVGQLRDHARQILETIADDMAAAQSEVEKADKSKGEGRLMKLSLEFAAKHADGRHEDGFDVNQVVSEYRALRASVIRLWTRDVEATNGDARSELTRFNEEIDQALTYAVQEFSGMAERTRGAILKELRDSEERYRAIAESLRQADKYKDEFLAILAHELRNPLAPVQTGLEVLRLTQGMPAAAQSPLAMMERQMAHLVRLVDDLLDISRISRGKVNLHLEKADVADIIRKAVETTTCYLYAGTRTVSIELPPEPLMVRGDPVRLAQILGNLLSNAGKHTEENGHIWVSARRDGHQAKIVVRDDGVGIAPDKVDKLFEMFRQLDATRRDGLGIGLALARKLVELHGGSITGRSEGLGQGAEFELYLPHLRAEEQTSSPDKEPKDIELDGLKVLVVDDNRDAAASLEMLLQLLGAQPRLAHDGPSALAQLGEFYPDLVLLDIGLPGMDGYEVARCMREQAEGKHIKIIAVSGLGQDEDRQRSLQAGINEHLVKPINLQNIKKAAEIL
ncbi:MAG: ATP-binding protein [Cellvibrionaceae bacterium]